MASRVETVRRTHELFNQGKLDELLASADPDFEWIPDERSPWQAARGPDALRSFLAELRGSFGQFQVTPERFVESNDEVVALLRIQGHGRATGAAFDIPVAHVWTFRKDQPIRGRVFADPGKAMEAHGQS
jgi:ketosteroid isomerase-like protein